jgi:radical SAM superfamily enzyme YgiQ (UPF0313 family)
MGLKHVMICEPLELEYVAAGLHGHEVQIMDLILEKGFGRRLAAFKPDVVGTSGYVTGVNEAIKLCRQVKRWNPRCLTVVGGVHAARSPEDFCDAAVDCIALGDGTTTMPKILECLQQGGGLTEVPGLALPGAQGITYTPPAPYMPDPDTLPFPRRDLTRHMRQRYYYLFHRPVALLKTLWGCWHRCDFCFTWRITDGATFLRSPESIVEELAGIEEDDVYIVDDIFLAMPERLHRLAELIRARGIRKKYLAYARADFIATHEDIIAEWAVLGLSAVFMGLEATTDQELRELGKHTSVDFNTRAIEVLRRHGVDTYASLITQPDYMPEDWERLWRFIERTGLYYVNISPLTPLPGTRFWDHSAHSLTVPRRAHSLFDLSHVLLPTRVPLRDYYRALLRLYMRTCLDPRRARRLSRRGLPAIWSPAYLRLWWGALQIYLQMRLAHRHHAPGELRDAQSRGQPWLAGPPAGCGGRPGMLGKVTDGRGGVA